MSEEEIILHNTFLNSRKRHPEDPHKVIRKKKKQGKSIAWREMLSTEHTYSENVPIAQTQTRPSLLEPKPRSESTNSRKGEESKGITGKILTAKQAIKADKASAILTEMNVTKKWTELK
jgi:hypothetical protein